MKFLFSFLLSLLFFLFYSCNHSSNSVQEKEKQALHADIIEQYNDSITLKLYEQANGWGYDISVKGDPYIHQPHKPAVPGTDGFESEDAARAVAQLMAYKVSLHILPPMVSVEELDSLDIR